MPLSHLAIYVIILQYHLTPSKCSNFSESLKCLFRVDFQQPWPTVIITEDIQDPSPLRMGSSGSALSPSLVGAWVPGPCWMEAFSPVC